MSFVSLKCPSLMSRLELPTWGLLALVYGGFGWLTWSYHSLPWWLVSALGGWLVCWHSQLQHEHLHGHPTRWPVLNGLLVAPGFGLWLPYLRYRSLHLSHHAAAALTVPGCDNESLYVDADRWQRLPRALRGLFWINQTLAGRLLVGPFLTVLPWLFDEARRLARGEGQVWLAWLLHALALAPLLYWLFAVCRIPLGGYLLFFIWPGVSLSLLRSFYEHRPAATAAQASVVVERAGPLGWLFLNNNLHALHHAAPQLAWYELPRVYAERRAELLDANGGFRFEGYGAWVRRYLFRPKDSPVHPGPSGVAPSIL